MRRRRGGGSWSPSFWRRREEARSQRMPPVQYMSTVLPCSCSLCVWQYAPSYTLTHKHTQTLTHTNTHTHTHTHTHTLHEHRLAPQLLPAHARARVRTCTQEAQTEREIDRCVMSYRIITILYSIFHHAHRIPYLSSRTQDAPTEREIDPWPPPPVRAHRRMRSGTQPIGCVQARVKDTRRHTHASARYASAISPRGGSLHTHARTLFPARRGGGAAAATPAARHACPSPPK